MNKEKATKFFAKALAEEGHIYFIEDPSMKKFIKEDARAFYPILSERESSFIGVHGQVWPHSSGWRLYERGEPVPIHIYPKYPDNVIGKGSFEGVENQDMHSIVLSESKDKEKGLLEFHAEQIIIQHAIKKANRFGANYLFVKVARTIDGNTYKYALSGFPYAVIRDNELDLLREMYKGDLSDKVRDAAQVLGIEKGIEIDYKQLSKSDPKKFCEYFQAVSDGKRAAILEDIWALIDKRNLDGRIQSLLRNDKYKNLALEIGRGKLKNA